ncbi:MAG: sugar ABC transporter permease [Actinobacteria bacterium]|nr:sugar ABC transporter permease [Actinomycetota bacterium]
MRIQVSGSNAKLNIQPYVYIAPALIVFVIFMFYPVVFTIALSFFKWNGYSKVIFDQFVGIKNYLNLLLDKSFWVAFKNTAYFVISGITFQLALALLFALIVYFGNFKYSNIIRAIIFFPGILSSVIVGLVWKKFFVYDGLINQFLQVVGFGNLAYPWLSNIYLPIWIIAFVNIWQWTGYNLVIFYAALQSIEHEHVEAAFIDGASLPQAVIKVVIPQLKPIIGLSAILNFIGGFRVFDLVWVLTRGGPAHSSEVLTTLMFYFSFDPSGPNRMGYAASVATILMIIIVIFSIVRIRVSKKTEQI